MEKTTFQRIIDREIPSTIEFEDDEIIAIRDIAPNAPVHVLIIPKRVIASIDAVSDADAPLVGRVFTVARDLARRYGIAESGYRVVTNINADGGQTVPHLHFHLLGGEPLGRMNGSGAGHTPAASTSSTTSTSGSRPLLDAGLLILASVGLAIGFNMMNPKAIPWVKKEYERVTATAEDIERYLAPSTTQQPTAGTSTAATPSATDVSAAQPAASAEKPTPAQPAQPTTSVQSGQSAATSTTSSAATTAPAQPAPAAFQAQPGLVKEISHDMFVRLMSSAPYYLIDARGAEKYAEGHIANAVNIYGGEVQSRIGDILQSVPRDRIILIYCDGGECELSHHVADVLKQFNYGPIFIYTGGWAEWSKKN
jgi:histidine triad (HIT) family protein